MKLSILHKVVVLATLLVVITTGTVTIAYYFSGTSLLVQRELENLTQRISREGELLQLHIKEMEQDAVIATSLTSVKRALVGDKKTRNENRRQVEIYLKELLHENKNYFQVRLIDIYGNEIVRVDRTGGELIVMPESSLQNKAKRSYYKETLKLASEEIYLSEINLNREYGKVVEPHRPTIRAATPVIIKESGQMVGMVVINMDIGNEFEKIKMNYQNDAKSLYITNDKGGYLAHPDNDRVYGFDLGKQYRVQEEFPQLAKLFLPENKDVSIVLLPDQTLSSKVVAFTKAHFDPLKKERFITIGIAEEYGSLTSVQARLLKNNIWWAVILVLFGAVMAVVFSLLITRPLKIITESLEAFGVGSVSGIKMLPVNRDDEFGTLARSFASLFNQVKESQSSLHELNENLESLVNERTAELKSSEEKQRAIVDTVVDGIITIDEYGTVQSLNPAATDIFGYSPDEVLGKNVKMLMPANYADEHDQYLENYRETNVAKIIGIGREVTGKRKNGETFPLDLAVSKMMIDGQPMFAGIVRDITERKRIEKMKNEFVSTVSHELRTPLTSIRGSLGLVMGGAAGEVPDAIKEMLKIAENNTQRLLLLINDILDTQKIESGSMSFRYARAEVMPLIEQVINDNSAYASQHFVKLKIINRVDDAYVYIDRDRIIQVLNNLLSNAAKFSPRGESIEVSVASHNGYIRLSVTDHGIGIPDDFKDKVFEKFTQSDSSDTRSKGGTGLGMSISKVIVEKHGGEINFVSKEGIGTTFYIELPEYAGQNESTQLDIGTENMPAHGSCVLIVEDDHDIAALLQRLMVEAGIRSDIAYDTEEARALLAKNHHLYKVVSLDIRLPGESGISFMNWMRNQPEFSDLPVVVVSVDANETKREINGGAVGVIDWINKPIDETRLIHAIRLAHKQNGLAKVLHVEDDYDVQKIVLMMLRDEAEIVQTRTLEDSRKALATQLFDMVLLDIGLPDGSGLDLLEDINKLSPAPQVVIFSAQDVSQQYIRQVAAVLSKSKTSNQELLETIKQFVDAR